MLLQPDGCFDQEAQKSALAGLAPAFVDGFRRSKLLGVSANGLTVPAHNLGKPETEVLTMDWRERIASDPDILMGKPVVKGTRISVELILGWLAQGWTHEMVLESYPHITRDDILAALAFAADMMRDEQYAAIHMTAA